MINFKLIFFIIFMLIYSSFAIANQKVISSETDFKEGNFSNIQLNRNSLYDCDAFRYISTGYDYPSNTDFNPAGTCNRCDGSGNIENVPNGLDTFNECDTIGCLTGNCDGTANCKNYDLIITHNAGDVAPVDKTITYRTITTNIAGTGTKCWIIQNLGAANQANSNRDNTNDSAGWYWQFNNKQGYEGIEYDASTPKPATWVITINENINWQSINDPCTIELGTGWRLPTSNELSNLAIKWDNSDESYNSILKIHNAGYLHFQVGLMFARGNSGYYWSNTQYSNTYGNNLFFNSQESSIHEYYKTSGYSVRCIKD